jgi:hypothetical protein
MASIRDTLYCIIGHTTKSTKKQNTYIFICPTKMYGPFFKHPLTQVLKSWIF